MNRNTTTGRLTTQKCRIFSQSVLSRARPRLVRRLPLLKRPWPSSSRPRPIRGRGRRNCWPFWNTGYLALNWTATYLHTYLCPFFPIRSKKRGRTRRRRPSAPWSKCWKSGWPIRLFRPPPLKRRTNRLILDKTQNEICTCFFLFFFSLWWIGPPTRNNWTARLLLFCIFSFFLLRLSCCDILPSLLHFSLINMSVLSDVRLMYKLIANLWNNQNKSIQLPIV